VQDHAKDVEFLNVLIVNHHFMQIVFGSSVAIGWFAMGSNEALGQPAEAESIDLKADAPAPTKEDGPSHKEKQEDKKVGKRKRVLNEEDAALLSGVTDVVWGLGAAISVGNHAEAALGIYEAVMGCPNFAKSDLMVCLNYLMDHKASTLIFVGMSPSDKELWINTHLAKVRVRWPSSKEVKLRWNASSVAVEPILTNYM